MNFPKLKHPLLCRITTYVAALGAFIAPMVAVICIPVIPEAVKAILSILIVVGLLVYLLCNFTFLMAVDIGLGVIQGYAKAYRQYPLQLDDETLEKRLSRFGKSCEPIALQPAPHMLRFKSTAPVTVYSSGIEKVVAVYRCGLLTKNEYHAIVNSALANSKALAGQKKHLLLDKAQKASSLNRVTVVLILTSAVEPELSRNLYDLVCKQEGDGFDEAVLPCVVDLSAKTCVFNSSRMPYFGMQYPVKNRGIRLIERYIFGGRLPKGQGSLMAEMEGIDPEKSLWRFWRELKRDWRDDDRKTKNSFRKMAHGQIRVEEDQLLLKWEDRGAAWPLQWTDEGKTAEIEVSAWWDHPKVRPMSIQHMEEAKDRIRSQLSPAGFVVRFVTPEEEE